MEKALIDTDIFIDHLRGHKPATVLFQSLHNASFSAITETELLAGQENSRRERRALLLDFLQRWQKIDVDNAIAKRAGDLCREHRMAVPDALIAATALRIGGTLVTRNVKHFKNIPGLQVHKPY